MRTKQVGFAVATGPLIGAWLLLFAGSTNDAAAQNQPPGFELGGDQTKGRKIFKMYCQKCHGKRGNGQGIMAPDLDPKPRDFTDAARMGSRSGWQVFLGIKEGGPAVGLSEQMAGWEDTLIEPEMRDVAAYIRQFAK